MDKHLRTPSQSATLNDVGALCGVSYQTVSRVVNESPFVAAKTRARVLKAIAELGYRPNLAARRLATRRSSVIGMVGTNITYYGPAQVMVSIEETAKRRGYNLMFAGIRTAEQSRVGRRLSMIYASIKLMDLVLGVRVDGSIDAIRKLCHGVPFVALDTNAAQDVPNVIVDQQYGTRLAIQHLLDLGHQQIACITGPPRWSASKERRKGWAKALKHVGLELGPCIEGDWSAESGFAAAAQVAGTRPERFHRDRGG